MTPRRSPLTSWQRDLELADGSLLRVFLVLDEEAGEPSVYWPGDLPAPETVQAAIAADPVFAFLARQGIWDASPSPTTSRRARGRQGASQ